MTVIFPESPQTFTWGRSQNQLFICRIPALMEFLAPGQFFGANLRGLPGGMYPIGIDWNIISTTISLGHHLLIAAWQSYLCAVFLCNDKCEILVSNLEKSDMRKWVKWDNYLKRICSGQSRPSEIIGGRAAPHHPHLLFCKSVYIKILSNLTYDVTMMSILKTMEKFGPPRNQAYDIPFERKWRELFGKLIFIAIEWLNQKLWPFKWNFGRFYMTSPKLTEFQRLSPNPLRSMDQNLPETPLPGLNRAKEGIGLPTSGKCSRK